MQQFLPLAQFNADLDSTPPRPRTFDRDRAAASKEIVHVATPYFCDGPRHTDYLSFFMEAQQAKDPVHYDMEELLDGAGTLTNLAGLVVSYIDSAVPPNDVLQWTPNTSILTKAIFSLSNSPAHGAWAPRISFRIPKVLFSPPEADADVAAAIDEGLLRALTLFAQSSWSNHIPKPRHAMDLRHGGHRETCNSYGKLLLSARNGLDSAVPQRSFLRSRLLSALEIDRELGIDVQDTEQGFK
ncbi:hypothetical protein MSAN_02507800 [Mycena sanguinolenta]|uniref:Uncharacterized protein n=1 Tax=Mycena sanguinolenta TaxID=230812 RepID=A0A8H6U0U3_9AGAR|nr:hypothetical protein MSAN_02507800 [Mycena sanguinolenta]